MSYLPTCAVDVRQQTIAHLDILEHLVEITTGIALLTHLPNLTIVSTAVETKHSSEGAELSPTQIEAAVFRVVKRTIVTPLVAHEESTIVVVPIRNSTSGESERGWNLFAKCFPRCRDVATPRLGGITLLSCKSTTCEDAHSLLCQLCIGGLLFAMMLIDSTHMAQHEAIPHDAPRASAVAQVVHFGITLTSVVGFGGVHPIGIYTLAHQSVVHVFPIDVACAVTPHIVRIDRGIAWITGHVDEPAQLLKFCKRLGVAAEVRPHTDEQMRMIIVNTVNHLLIVAERGIEKFQSVPLRVISPILPILHHAVDWHMKLPVFLDDSHRFAGTLVAFLRLIESEVPKRHHASIACQPAHGSHHSLAVVACQDVVVDFATRTLEVSVHIVIAESGRRVVVPEESIVLARLEIRNAHAHVPLLEVERATAAIQFVILNLSHAEDVFVFIECKSGTNSEAVIFIHVRTFLERGAITLFANQRTTICAESTDVSIFPTHLDGDVAVGGCDDFVIREVGSDVLTSIERTNHRHAQFVDVSQERTTLQNANHMVCVEKNIGVER